MRIIIILEKNSQVQKNIVLMCIFLWNLNMLNLNFVVKLNISTIQYNTSVPKFSKIMWYIGNVLRGKVIGQ